MRITDNMRFYTTISYLSGNQSLYNELMEKISTQKKVNRASDNPLSAMKILEIRKSLAASKQYTSNIESSNNWLSATETTLSSAGELLDTISSIATGAIGADDSTREIEAEQIQDIIDSLRSLANTKWGDRYLFSGTQEGVEPFTAEPSAASIGEADAAGNNQFGGLYTAGGAYTGNTNNTYVLKITEEGTLGTAKYRISSDGGKTWGSETLSDSSGLINLGEGVTLQFDDLDGTEPFGINDTYYVDAHAAGYYQGNDGFLSATINRNTVFDYSISGAQAFTEAGGVDIFETLTALKQALQDGNDDAIQAQQENIELAQDQILRCESLCGVKKSHLEAVKNNLTQFDESLENLLSDAQDADLTELGAKMLVQENALQASYSVAAKIGELSILNYLA